MESTCEDFGIERHVGSMSHVTLARATENRTQKCAGKCGSGANAIEGGSIAALPSVDEEFLLTSLKDACRQGVHAQGVQEDFKKPTQRDARRHQHGVGVLYPHKYLLATPNRA